MKNIRIYLILSLIALFSLSLAACDGVASAEVGSFQQDSSYVRGADDSSYNSSSSLDSGAVFTSSSDSSSSSSELKFKGTIEDVTANTITINGMTFTVDTQVDLTTLFTVGSMFQIEYRQNPDGTISILKFSSEDSSDDNYLEFKGMLEAVTADTITINGETFTVVTTEDLTTLFTAGQFFEIKYTLNEDGTISILQFKADDGSYQDSSEDYDVEFEGMVEAVTADTITLNGETFTVSTQEDLTTLFTAGEFYEIKYIFNPDGTITIVSFHADDSSDMYDDSSDYMDDSNNNSYNNNDDDNSYDDSSSNNNHNNDSSNNND